MRTAESRIAGIPPVTSSRKGNWTSARDTSLANAPMTLASVWRYLDSRWLARPWALCAPIIVLLISIPLMRAVRAPDPRAASDEEQSRLATVQAIVEHGTLAIEDTSFRNTRAKIIGVADSGQRLPIHVYSSQPPLYAVLLSGPYYVMHRHGLTFATHPNLVIFWLTLLGVTLPVALAAGLVYCMGRIFELNRPLRAALALIVVIASGMISYSTVLNAHAPAAALLLAAAACLIHVIAHRHPTWSTSWLSLAGVCAALAAAIDPPALVFLILFVLVITAFRWPKSVRVIGVALYAIGAAVPMAVHAKLNRAITGDLRAGIFHPELAVGKWRRAERKEQEAAAPRPAGSDFHAFFSNTADAPAALQSPLALPAASPLPVSALAVSPGVPGPEEEEPQSAWKVFWRHCYQIVAAFVGPHGVLSHFPVVLMGIIGVSLIMHRHWPAATKMLAGTTLAGGLAIILVYAICQSDTRDAMFATRWFVVFLPLTLFWAGAWLRRAHRQSSWILAGTLLVFSVGASLLGATGPIPRDGFDRYTVAGAWHNLTHPPELPPAPSPIVDSNDGDAYAQ